MAFSYGDSISQTFQSGKAWFFFATLDKNSLIHINYADIPAKLCLLKYLHNIKMCILLAVRN